MLLSMTKINDWDDDGDSGDDNCNDGDDFGEDGGNVCCESDDWDAHCDDWDGDGFFFVYKPDKAVLFATLQDNLCT